MWPFKSDKTRSNRGTTMSISELTPAQCAQIEELTVKYDMTPAEIEADTGIPAGTIYNFKKHRLKPRDENPSEAERMREEIRRLEAQMDLERKKQELEMERERHKLEMERLQLELKREKKELEYEHGDDGDDGDELMGLVPFLTEIYAKAQQQQQTPPAAQQTLTAAGDEEREPFSDQELIEIIEGLPAAQLQMLRTMPAKAIHRAIKDRYPVTVDEIKRAKELDAAQGKKQRATA